MNLTSVCTFGRSRLVISPPAFGDVTFDVGRRVDNETVSCAVFDVRVERGDNFVDTDDASTRTVKSEAMFGRFGAERDFRDGLVIATEEGLSRRGNRRASFGLADLPSSDRVVT